MKRVLSLIIAITLCISLCACGGNNSSQKAEKAEKEEIKLSPAERLSDDVKEYISDNYRISIGDSFSEPVSVDIASVVDKSENEWVILGTYTVKVDNTLMSSAFGIVATYDEDSDKFVYSQEKFDEFKPQE